MYAISPLSDQEVDHNWTIKLAYLLYEPKSPALLTGDQNTTSTKSVKASHMEPSQNQSEVELPMRI